MKKFILPIAFLTLAAGCCSEFNIMSDDVPPAVSAAFQTKYAGAQVSRWEVEKGDDGHLVYEAEFKLNGKSMEAEFKPDGTFVKEE